MSGKHISRCIYGYKAGKNNQDWVIDEPAAEIVKLIYKLFIGGKGFASIAKYLQEQKVLTSVEYAKANGRYQTVEILGKYFCCSTTVSKILSYQEYVGYTVNFRTCKPSYKSKRQIINDESKLVIFPNTHEPIIDRDIVIDDGVPKIVSDELFQLAQERLIKNQRSRSRFKAKIEYFLSAKLICGDCGSAMVGESGTSGAKVRYNYYKCVSAKKKAGCHRKSIRKDYIEEIVLHDVMEKMFTEDMVSDIAEKVIKLQEKENTAVPLLKKQLADVEKGLDNLITAMQMGMLTKSTKKRLDELEEQKERLEMDILKEEIQQDILTKGQVIAWLKSMKRLDLSVDDNKRRLVDTFVNAVYLYDDRVVISFNCRERASKIALSKEACSSCARLGEPSYFKLEQPLLVVYSNGSIGFVA